MRVVHCDFCGAALTSHAYECPCADFDYDTPRTGLEPGAPVIDGSIGSWLACDACHACIRDGDREQLLARAVITNYGRHSGGSFKVPVAFVDDLRTLHDQFWVHRQGPPVPISRAQLNVIARGPATVREPKGEQ